MRICGPKELRDGLQPGTIDTTSRSKSWSRGLSPMVLGPITFGDVTSQTMENLWQFTKLYPQHMGLDGKPTEAYLNWAIAGWSSKRAERYPMGKGAKPLFSLWQGKQLDYIEARKQIYVPAYATAVRHTVAFRQLQKLPQNGLVMFDFDGYNYGEQSLSQVLNNPERKMGHAFVLAMLLTRDPALEECGLPRDFGVTRCAPELSF